MTCVFFFFQAEDGIRDYKVTGVQTCALPIYPRSCPKTSKFIAPSTLAPCEAGKVSLIMPVVGSIVISRRSDRKSVV